MQIRLERCIWFEICDSLCDRWVKIVILISLQDLNGIFISYSGDNTKQVHMEGYAVSAQCMALVRDNCLLPTKDAPELGYVRESTDKQYVPDVYYKVSDGYMQKERKENNGSRVGAKVKTMRHFG